MIVRLLALTATSADSSNQREEEEQSSSFAVFGGNINSPYFYYVDGDYIEYLILSSNKTL